jgi:putative ABC transport system permease protein
VVVVVGATLLVRSFNALRGVDPGFDTANLLVVDLAVPASRYDPAATVAFYRQLVDGMGTLTGVRQAALASDVPPVSGGHNWDLIIDGRPKGEEETSPSPNVRMVSREYFATMNIPVAAGRPFGGEDHASSAPVALINETTAAEVWPGASPVGQRVRFSTDEPWVTIIGVTRDVRSTGPAQPAPSELYLLHEQMPAITGGATRAMYLVARTAVEPLQLAAAARSLVREMDPQLAITGILSMDELMARSVARQRFTMTLLSAFGIVALALAAIGIYGIMAYGVKRRTREIGIRMALGAQQREVQALIVRQGMLLALAGLAAGVVASLLLRGFMSRLLFGISATDPVTYIGIVALLSAVALAATWIPARRATLTDPSAALRMD